MGKGSGTSYDLSVTVESEVGVGGVTAGVSAGFDYGYEVDTTTGSASDALETYHDRIREVVVARLDVASRAECHRRLAHAYEATGRAAGDPQALLRHLEKSGDDERAARYAARAARKAAELLAFEQAAELYAAALRLGRPGEANGAELRLGHAEALANAGRGADAAAAYLACAADDPARRSGYRRLAADHYLRCGHLERGTAVLSSVLDDIGETFPKSDVHALAALAVVRARIALGGRNRTQDAHGAIPAGWRERLDVYHAVSATLSLVDLLRGGLFQSRAFLLASRVGEPVPWARSAIMEAIYAASTGRDAARTAALMTKARRIAEDTAEPYLRGAIRLGDGFVAYHAGAFRSAAVHFDAGAAYFRDAVAGTYHEQSVCRTFRLVVLRHRGDFAALQDGFAAAVRDAESRGDLFTEAALGWHLNVVRLAEDVPDEAARQLARVRWQPEGLAHHTQHWYGEHARAELALYTGDARCALPHFRKYLRRGWRTPIFRVHVQRAVATWLLGRLLVSDGNGSRALGEASHCAARLESERFAYARVWALLLRAGIAHSRGEHTSTLEHLNTAIDSGTNADLPICVAAAKLRLGELLGGDEGRRHVDAALSFMSGEKLRNPRRFVELWAPGFAPR